MHQGNFLGGLLGLLNAAANDACICAEMDEGASLGAANGAGASGDEQDSAICAWAVSEPSQKMENKKRTENAVLPH
jgi:hypothetical protein